MTNIFKFAVRGIDKFTNVTGTFFSWLSGFLVVVVCYDVFTRYALKKSSIGVQELEWHIFALLFIFGAASTLKHDKHVRVDVLYSTLSTRKKACINTIGSILMLIPFLILIIYRS